MSERGEAAAGKPVAASFRSGWLVVVMLCGCVAPRVFRAPEAPAAVCAGVRRPAREPSAPRASLGASARSPARPRRRPPAPRQVPPVPSTPVVPGVLMCGASARSPARPRRRPRAPRQVPPAPVASQGPRALRFLAVLLRVVTNVVNPAAFSLKIVVFGRRLTTFVTEVLGRAFKLLRFDDVCNVVRPRVPRRCPVG